MMTLLSLLQELAYEFSEPIGQTANSKFGNQETMIILYYGGREGPF